MKNKFTIRLSLYAVCFMLIGFVSCDDDFASVGSGIIGNFNFNTDSVTYPVTTYNQDVGAIQSDNLPAYLIGFNNDPLYGSFTA
ncbi:MAG: DUF4270 family protein, partial [Flavobacteriaceae bacterium]|nr:DUF4270 family protein [Flavobacteriaceae bacterium]